MVRVRARPPGTLWRVVFDGQSRNNYPAPTLSVDETYPRQLMSGRQIPWANVSVDAQPWAALLNDDQTRLHPQANHATNTVLVMCGGETDIALGATGQAVYDTEVTYGNAARTAGFNWVISCTMCGYEGLEGDAPKDAAREAFNTLVLSDASNAFDGVADLDATALADWNDPTYYIDAPTGGIHWKATGATLAAATFEPVLEALPGFPAYP